MNEDYDNDPGKWIRDMESIKNRKVISHILSSMYGHDLRTRFMEKRSDQFRRYENINGVNWWTESDRLRWEDVG